MRVFFRENKFLIIALCFFTLVSGVSIGNRFAIEHNNKTYDIVADYNEINLMAGQTHKNVSYWLKQFRDQMNITKIGILEESISSLMDDDSNMHVSGKVMDQVMQDANWESNYPKELIDAMNQHGYDKYDVLVQMGSQEAVDFVLPAIKDRFEKDKYYTVELNGQAYAVIDGDSTNALYKESYKLIDSQKGGFTQRLDVVGSKIMYISLGLLPEKVAAVQDLGMQVVPRTLCYDGFNGNQFAKSVVAGYNKYGIVPEYLIAGGDSVMGHDDGIQFAEKYIQDHHIKIGLIETTTQFENILQYGVEDIAKDNDYNAVRIFSVWDYIQNRYQYYGYKGAEEIENTLFRAVTERNVRVIYYKPIKENKDLTTYVTDVKEYKTMFQNLENRLEKQGFTYGSATTMKNYQVGYLLKLLMAFGCVAGVLLLLRAFTPIRKREVRILGVLGMLGAAGADYIMPNSFGELLSFSSAVIFACLAITLFTRLSKEFSNHLTPNTSLGKIIVLSGLTLIACVLVALMGAMMTAAPISSTRYMLEIDAFRGVKLAQLLPIAYFGVIYLAYYGYNTSMKTRSILEIHDIRELLNTSIKIWMILLGAVIGGVGYYYIARTGHESGVEVSTTEMLFRNFLEDTLIARPRNKEFLCAFPAIMLMVTTSIRRYKLWPMIFGLAGVIGLTSVINTFMHIRTPLYLGFARTGYSLLFGLIVGVIGILVFEGIHMVYVRYLIPFFQNYAKKEEAGN